MNWDTAWNVLAIMSGVISLVMVILSYIQITLEEYSFNKYRNSKIVTLLQVLLGVFGVISTLLIITSLLNRTLWTLIILLPIILKVQPLRRIILYLAERNDKKE